MNKKIISKSKRLTIILKYIGVFIISISGLLIVGIFLDSNFLDNLYLESSQSSFVFFNASYWEGVETPLVQIKERYIELITGLMVTGSYAGMFFLASFIFKDISNGESPFNDKQVKRLKKISRLLIGVLFIPLLLPNILHWMMISGKYFSISLDGVSLIAPILFYALVEIFAYGALLQREIDETL
ncbi:MAG: DUF2975 domain-containing protein [Carnobacterium sp.]|nr:DUF2975 domain-containing protein [Carnobacterium sp.]